MTYAKKILILKILFISFLFSIIMVHWFSIKESRKEDSVWNSAPNMGRGLMAIIPLNSLSAEVIIKKDNIANINISIAKNFINAIELNHKITNISNIDNNYIRVKQMDDKSFIIYIPQDNLPTFLGKIIITDEFCNKYALAISKGQQTKDNVYYITNSDNNKHCSSLDKTNLAPYAKHIQYSN